MISVEGTYRNGRVEFTNPPPVGAEESPVIVTFLKPRYVDLRERGISEDEARDLRGRLAAFAEDWDRPEMDVYDAG